MKWDGYSCLPWRSILYLHQISALGGQPLWTVLSKLPFSLSPSCIWPLLDIGRTSKSRRIKSTVYLFLSCPPSLEFVSLVMATFLYCLSFCWETIIPWLQVLQGPSITIPSFPFDNTFVLVALPSIVISINPAHILHIYPSLNPSVK